MRQNRKSGQAELLSRGGCSAALTRNLWKWEQWLVKLEQVNFFGLQGRNGRVCENSRAKLPADGAHLRKKRVPRSKRVRRSGPQRPLPLWRSPFCSNACRLNEGLALAGIFIFFPNVQFILSDRIVRGGNTQGRVGISRRLGRTAHSWRNVCISIIIRWPLRWPIR